MTTMNTFLHQLKCTELSPLYKKDNRNKNKFRPASVLTCKFIVTVRKL